MLTKRIAAYCHILVGALPCLRIEIGLKIRRVASNSGPAATDS